MSATFLEGVPSFRLDKGNGLVFVTANTGDGISHVVAVTVRNFIAGHLAAAEVIAKWRLDQIDADRPAIPISRGKKRR